MNIGLLAVDSRYPNLALMKISSYHKAQGDRVEWYSPLSRYDKVYLAKVFTFTPDYAYFLNADEAERGGTGYDHRHGSNVIRTDVRNTCVRAAG